MATTANLPTTGGTAPRGWAHWLPLACTLVLLAVAAKRIKTYITAQDPYWYIGLAHSILGGRSDPAEFAHGISYVSPGFPLLLAGCIKLFGVFAPYWLNPVLAAGFFLLYAELIRRILPSRHAVAIVAPATLLVFVAGYGLNIHFLLYPFRGMPIYFLTVLGMTLLVAWARPTGNAWAYAAAGCPFAVAVTIREPAVFAMAGAALWILSVGGIRRAAAWRRLIWFILPAAMGTLGAMAIVMTHGRALNNQLASWLDIVSGKRPDDILATARTMLGYLLHSIRWSGVALTVLGLWACRRNRAILCFFAAPALAFFVFYSLYIPHYRYLLTVLVYLCPVMGAGLLWAVDSAHRRLPRARIPAIASALLIVAGAVPVRTMEPWSRKVTSRQVDEVRRTLTALAPDGGVAFVDQSCRYLVDALICYSDLAVRNPAHVRAELDAGRRCFSFEPLDENGYYEGYRDGSLPPLGPPPSRILPFYARTEQLLNPDGTPLVIVVANGHFAVQEVRPWTSHQVRERYFFQGAVGYTFWLDFGEQTRNTHADVRLVDGDGAVLAIWPEVSARHIQGFHVSAEQAGRGLRVIDVRSDTPLPPTLLRGAVADGDPIRFSLDQTRSLSTHYWLQPPFPAPRVSQPEVGQLVPAGRLILPVPLTADERPVEYRLVLDVPEGQTGQELRIARLDGATATWPAERRRSYALFVSRPPHRQDRVAADLRVNRPDGTPAARLEEVAIVVK